MTKLTKQVSEKSEFYRDNGDYAVMEIEGFASIIDEAYRLLSASPALYVTERATWLETYDQMIKMGDSVAEG